MQDVLWILGKETEVEAFKREMRKIIWLTGMRLNMVQKVLKFSFPSGSIDKSLGNRVSVFVLIRMLLLHKLRLPRN
jgi:hypothetical protein